MGKGARHVDPPLPDPVGGGDQEVELHDAGRVLGLVVDREAGLGQAPGGDVLGLLALPCGPVLEVLLAVLGAEIGDDPALVVLRSTLQGRGGCPEATGALHLGFEAAAGEVDVVDVGVEAHPDAPRPGCRHHGAARAHEGVDDDVAPVGVEGR